MPPLFWKLVSFSLCCPFSLLSFVVLPASHHQAVNIMTHQYSETTQRIQPASFSGLQEPKDIKSLPKEPTIIRYNGGVTSGSGERGGLLFTRPNLVKKYQKLFQSGDPALPIYLKKGRSDQLIYQGLMISSVVGLTVAFFGLYRMAMPKKS